MQMSDIVSFMSMEDKLNDNKFVYNGETFKTGDKVTCAIGETPVTDAIVFVRLNNSNCNYITAYICQNVQKGISCEEKFGYNFSWRFRISECDILTDAVSQLKFYTPPIPRDVLVDSISDIIGKNPRLTDGGKID